VKYVTGFFAFWYDFIIGDDWRMAAGAVIALGVAAALAHAGIPAWWVVPIVVATLLSFSLWRASRSAG
jgi:hypothetical protein